MRQVLTPKCRSHGSKDEFSSLGSSSCGQNMKMSQEMLRSMVSKTQLGGVETESEAKSRCHGLRQSEADSDQMTAEQLKNVLRDSVYHMVMSGSIFQDKPLPFFVKEGGQARLAGYWGWFSQVDDGAALWGISCPPGAVVVSHDGVASGSPHCLHASANSGDIVLTTHLSASARCEPGQAVGGWFNLPGIHKVYARAATDPGPPEDEATGFKLVCRTVPHLSSLCETKDSKCGEDEVVSGFEYEPAKYIRYRCCKLPRVIGFVFHEGLENVKSWEGYYCPVSYDLTGRPLYELDRPLGPDALNLRVRPPIQSETWNLQRSASEITEHTGALDWWDMIDSAKKVQCPAGSVMAQFQPVWKEYEKEEFQFLFTCMAPGMDPDGGFGLSPDGCEKKVDDGWRFECGDDEALQDWKAARYPGIGHIEGTCCKLSNAIADSTKYSLTDLTDGQTHSGATYAKPFLRENYACPPGHALQKIQLSPTDPYFYCVKVAVARHLKFSLSEQFQFRKPALSWDRFRGSWILQTSPVIEIIQPIIVSSNFKAHCPDGFAMEAWRYDGIAQSVTSYSMMCSKIQKDKHEDCKDASAETETETGTKQTTMMRCDAGYALTGWDVTQPAPGADYKWFNYVGTCCKIEEGTTTACQASKTAQMSYQNILQDKELQEDLSIADMAVDCQGGVLHSITHNWKTIAPGVTRPVSLEIDYMCCTGERAEQLGGIVSQASEPQNVVDAKVQNFESGTKSLGVQVRAATLETSFWLDQSVWKTFPVVGTTNMRALVLNPFTHRHDEVLENLEYADIQPFTRKLNALPPGTVVVVAEPNAWGRGEEWENKELEFALHRCGSNVDLQSIQGKSYAFIGVCGGSEVKPTALAEDLKEDGDIWLEADVPDLFSVAPISNFDASYVLSATDADPFPSEKPVKPELSQIRTQEPEYDQFCDLDVRSNLQNVDCQSNRRDCPGEDHPCFHTYDQKVDESNWWSIAQRDKEREYKAGLAEIGRRQYEKDVATTERTLQSVIFGLEIAAGLAAAIAPGSWSSPAQTGAEKGGKAAAQGTLNQVARTAAKKAADLADQAKQNAPSNLQNAPLNFQKVQSNLQNLQSAAGVKKSTGLGQKLRQLGQSALGGAGRALGNARGVVQNKAGKLDKFLSSDTFELVNTAVTDGVPLIPHDLGDYPFQVKTTEQFNLAKYLDANPIQTGLSKIMCDLYCAESAVKESTSNILDNMRWVTVTLQSNLEKLMDYHSQLMSYNLGLLRDELTPSSSDLLQNSSPSELSEIETLASEMKALPKMLETNFDPSHLDFT